VPVSVLDMLVAWIVTAVAVAVQGVVGFGMALVSVPILSLVDGRLAPVPQLLIALPMTAFMAWRERHDIDMHGLGWIVAGRFPGAAIGLGLLAIATERTLGVMISLIVLFAVAVVGFGLHVPRNPATSFLAGVVAGVAGLVASVGGPPLALIYHRDRGPVIRASLGAVFVFGLTVSIAARGLAGEISGDELQVAFLLLPAVAVGLAASGPLLGRIEGERLRIAILVLSAAAAAGLLLRSLAM
jgi:uncharacterized membrane protein YfcA